MPSLSRSFRILPLVLACALGAGCASVNETQTPEEAQAAAARDSLERWVRTYDGGPACAS